jgi:hypothetical protein
MAAAERLLLFLKHTGPLLVVYFDSNWGTCPATQRGVSGIVIIYLELLDLVQYFPVRSGSGSVWVFSILNHGRVTHGFGLYKAGVGLQGNDSISVILCPWS